MKAACSSAMLATLYKTTPHHDSEEYSIITQYCMQSCCLPLHNISLISSLSFVAIIRAQLHMQNNSHESCTKQWTTVLCTNWNSWQWLAVVQSCEATSYATVADGHLRRFYSVAASNLLVTTAATAFKQRSEYY